MANIKKITTKKAASRKIKFAIEAPQAKTVTIAGSFNNWDASSTPLRKSKNKIWSKDITLKPGRYEYRFVVDGSWTNDPNNPNRATNTYGSENSVIQL